MTIMLSTPATSTVSQWHSRESDFSTTDKLSKRAARPPDTFLRKETEENSMKKFLSALSITTFLIRFSGCSGNSNSSAEYANSSVSQVVSAGSDISSSVEESTDSDNKSLNGDERLSEKDGLLVYTDDLYTISADSTKWTICNVENYVISFSYMGEGNDTAPLEGVQNLGPIEVDINVNMIV